MEHIRCLNCSIRINPIMRRCRLGDLPQSAIRILQAWIPHAFHNAENEQLHVCDGCRLILEPMPELTDEIPARTFGHNEVCLGCGISLLRTKSHRLAENSVELNTIRTWNVPYQLRRLHRVCRACWYKVHRQIQRRRLHDAVRPLENVEPIAVAENVELLPAHVPDVFNIADSTCWQCYEIIRRRNMRRLCVGCGIGLANHYREDPQPREVIQQEEAPNEPRDEGLPPPVPPPVPLPVPPPGPPPIPPPVPPPLPQQVLVPDAPVLIQKITLPAYKRVGSTSRHCVFNGCDNFPLVLIPKAVKGRLLLDHSLFIPACARICPGHLQEHDWDQLSRVALFNDFTALQIQLIVAMVREHTQKTIDFDNIREMDPHLSHYWLGYCSEEFYQILEELPSLQGAPHPERSLAIFLTKLRTGDSNERLASLFKMSRSNLENYMNRAREALTQDFVPIHLGTQHMTIDNVVHRNKIIPNGLFGAPELPLNERPAIVICDGTYVYVQKSSNYSFQKKTYSLHKYQNLVKPFLIVCCDGYILDVCGPYSAVESDASIMGKLFHEGNEMREFFRENDIFILDRGFRDVIARLEGLGYRAHMPESKDEGAYQLTTAQANRNRFVTLCRWVVEVVNGRFKRDFKLFRQEYFNRGAQHLMKDFRICAALLNKFHVLIDDGPNAQEIVNIALARKNVPNFLGEYINEGNVNRRRAHFVNINVNDVNLNNFPRLTIHDLIMFALGIYQLKQARSYYGEHVRENGTYEVEVCMDLEMLNTNNPNLMGDNYLLRGRIRSRHTNRKKYYTYLLISEDVQLANNLQAIKGYYCSCLVGARTVGCCAHVMTIIWYLSWARHEQRLEPPAQFLDNVLIFEEYGADDDA